jgi:4-hydroxybenzoate polyprenyltransferase
MLIVESKNFFESSLILFKSRREVIFAVTWTASLASIIAGKGLPPITKSFLSIIATMMIVASVYIYNDVIDREMDAHSEQDKKKARPIAHGKVSQKNAMMFVYLTGLIGLGACFMINLTALIIGSTYYVLVFLYSYPGVRFKDMFILKNLITALLMPTAFLICGVAIESRVSSSIALISFTYYALTVLLQPAIADMLDYQEDISFNVRTIGNTLSWKQDLVLYNIGIIMFVASSIISYFVFSFHYIVPTITTLLCVYLMVYSYKLRDENGENASYKLRPVTYSLLLMNPLLLALGAVF